MKKVIILILSLLTNFLCASPQYGSLPEDCETTTQCVETTTECAELIQEPAVGSNSHGQDSVPVQKTVPLQETEPTQETLPLQEGSTLAQEDYDDFPQSSTDGEENVSVQKLPNQSSSEESIDLPSVEDIK